MTANTFDVAAYILEKQGPMSAMKLQKLLYYSQAWNMVWEEEPLFDEDFQAWANGPVLPTLYARHRGMFIIDSSLFDSSNTANLKKGQTDNIDKVLSFYGDQTAQWLSNLTHQETPWLSARGDLPPGASSTAIIDKGSMHEYYSSL